MKFLFLAENTTLLPRIASNLAEARKYFQKKPLGRRRHLMSTPVRDCEFSTATSGTERERGFVGKLSCLSEPSFKISPLPLLSP